MTSAGKFRIRTLMYLPVAVRDCLDPLENELRLDHDRVLDPGFRHGRVLDTGSGRRRGLDLGLCCDHVRDPLATAGHSCGSNQHLVPYRHRRLLCLRDLDHCPGPSSS